MADSDSSSLSSAPASGDERLAPIFLNAKGKGPKKRALVPLIPVPPPRKRTPSPELPETLADNPNIAFIVMFRNRFSEAFPAKLAHLGPQDLERGVVDSMPSPQIEDLLCALLGIVLNRKKPVERGHHGRALEEAISSQRAQWPKSWNDVNPISSSKSFNTMTPAQRLDLLRHLIIWALSTSEQVSNIIKESYKQTRHDDDQNQPLSVQPWGKDSDKRAFYLIEGQDDTSFRVYREANRTQSPIWRSVAGSIDEIKELATKLEKDASISARQMAKSIQRTIPRFEATEEKRRRREYRQQQRSRFTRPEPGFSLYEGRTRGKRMRYTFDDDDDIADELGFGEGTRRSGRHSDRSTPIEPPGPVVTASGRQVKQRGGGIYGEIQLGTQATAGLHDVEMEDANSTDARASRSNGRRGQASDEGTPMSDRESESDGGWNSAENENEEYNADEDGEDDAEDSDEEPGTQRSSVMVVIKLPNGGANSNDDHPKMNGVDQTPDPDKRTDSELGSSRTAIDGDMNGHGEPTLDTTGSGSTTAGITAEQEPQQQLPPSLAQPHQIATTGPAGGDVSDTQGEAQSTIGVQPVQEPVLEAKSSPKGVDAPEPKTTAPQAEGEYSQADHADHAGAANGATKTDQIVPKVEGMNGTAHQSSVTV